MIVEIEVGELSGINRYRVATVDSFGIERIISWLFLHPVQLRQLFFPHPL